MSVAIKLDNLTTAEKLQFMERLWEDLSANASESLSPTWHGEVLNQREEMVAEGESTFLALEDVKNHLRNSK